MKNLILLIVAALLVSCSSQRAMSVKSVKLKEGTGGRVGVQEFKECTWAVSIGLGSPFDKFSVEQIIRDNDPKVYAVNDLKITHSGFGMYGVGRFCMKVEGEYYAIK
jgi:hypothetical protein